MNCEEIILSVIVILLLMILIAYVCKCATEQYRLDTFSDLEDPEDPANKPEPKYMWGGVPISFNSVMDHGETGLSRGELPIINSLTAIKRLQAESYTPPWDTTPYQKSSGAEYVDHFMQKKRFEGKAFPSRGMTKNTTAVRYMKLEK